MMHTVRSSVMNGDTLHESVSGRGVGEFQKDIALMDAQLANLSSLCNNIQNNYYDMNKRLDKSQEICDDIEQIPKRIGNDGQIGTMEAWSLLQSIQHNLASIDDDMSAINNDRGRNSKSRWQQLKHIKSKTKHKGKRRKTKAELSRNLEQQTDLLNEIYNKLSQN